ncbi:hypothetical protein NTE_03232 [Candidatus Nitrososphaera evergladensis SR1]|uniref:Plastocyanin n=1 Tax=Candidatus Nitrososphaera evergladensis SR1 TaxID=1459636 RepID=A0A075MUD5_9ARCH|nr:hypothetical protein [Candidatus Nitrososphaera evergladensis]AIF85261.1 hypothetical protein NTE_03232 [Candidatus Nitrososphaera evergladensis SR1]
MAVAGAASLTNASQEQFAQQQQDATKSPTSTSAATTVHAGSGGPVGPLTIFSPSRVEIKVGEKVVWTNPSLVSEPHTVTFMKDNSTFADFGSPFIVSKNTTFTPVSPGSNGEPFVVPNDNDTNIVVTLNKRSFFPVIINSEDKTSYLAPNAEYTMDGTEKYVNSGWIWPKDQAPQGVPPINQFAVTFTQAGTYNYVCLVHPWMKGQVVVAAE